MAYSTYEETLLATLRAHQKEVFTLFPRYAAAAVFIVGMLVLLRGKRITSGASAGLVAAGNLAMLLFYLGYGR